MKELVREKLAEMVARHARPPDLDARRCEGFLRDLCREQGRREINVLVTALRLCVVEDLLASGGTMPPQVLVARSASKLIEQAGIATDLARWAVESWAVALGVIPRETITATSRAEETVTAPPGSGITAPAAGRRQGRFHSPSCNGWPPPARWRESTTSGSRVPHTGSPPAPSRGYSPKWPYRFPTCHRSRCCRSIRSRASITRSPRR